MFSLVVRYQREEFVLVLPKLPTITLEKLVANLFMMNGQEFAPSSMRLRYEGRVLNLANTLEMAIQEIGRKERVLLVVESWRKESSDSEEELSFDEERGLTPADVTGSLGAHNKNLFEETDLNVPSVDEDSGSETLALDESGEVALDSSSELAPDSSFGFDLAAAESPVSGADSDSQVIHAEGDESSDDPAETGARPIRRRARAQSAGGLDNSGRPDNDLDTSCEDEESFEVEAGSVPAVEARQSPRGRVLPKTVSRHATVRYYCRMNPERTYPLVVVLSEEQLKTIVQKGVAEARAKFKVKDDSSVEIEPILPGCLCYPPRETVEVKKKSVQGSFWVVPHVRGTVRGARIVLRQAGRIISEIPLEISVVNPAIVTVMGIGALVLPFGSAILRHYKLDFESQLERGFAPYQSILQWLSNSLRPEIAALVLLSLTGMAYLCLRPKRTVSFWDFQSAKWTRRTLGRRISTAMRAGLAQGKTAAFLGAAIAALLGVLIAVAVGIFSSWERALWTGGLIAVGLVLLGAVGGFLTGTGAGFVESMLYE
jgi:hypothetical protein